MCADLQRISLAKLQQDFGRKMGEMLHQNCRGIDNKVMFILYHSFGLFMDLKRKFWIFSSH